MIHTLIKFGGSIITNKKRYRSFNEKTTRRLIKELKSDTRYIIVHGAGSFGHILAEQWKKAENGSQKNFLLSRIHYDVRDLNLRVLKIFLESNISAVSVPPFAVVKNQDHVLQTVDISVFDKLLDADIIPITYGDVVLDSVKKFSITSGDDLIYYFANYYHPEKVIFVSNVDGIYRNYPPAKGEKPIKIFTADTYEKIKFSKIYMDVTGGLKRKIDIAMRLQKNLKIPTFLINGSRKGALRRALQNENIGTRFG